MIRCDFPGNIKRGGVCVYYKEGLPLTRRDDISNFDQCVVCEIKVKKSKCFVSCMYRSQNESEEEREMFCQKFETTCHNMALEKPMGCFIVGDFNAKCTSWWPDEINNQCGLMLNDISTFYSYTQLIHQPTNFEPNKSPSCIDLFFTTQPNLVLESGVLPSPSKTCHHQIIFDKIKFEVFRPPPFKREVWHFKEARVDLIRLSIDRFDWHGAFANLGVDQQVELFTETLLNNFRNFIPHELKTCKAKDSPWMTNDIKKALQRKNRLYKKYISREDKHVLDEHNSRCYNLIASRKESYYSNLGHKLNNSKTSSKAYWSILNRFMGRSKTPVIPPLLVEDKLETDFQKQANFFNEYFSSQCCTLTNSSTLPPFSLFTNHSTSKVVFNDDDISKILKDLNPNKAHGFDSISKKMIQICGDSIVRPLSAIFKNALKSGTFPENWKKGNIVPVHKKSSKQQVNNYRPISLLPIFGKVFEKVIFNNLFNYFQSNNILTDKQSGFRPGDSCVNQLVAITHEIYKAFDGNTSLEIRGVFLDMSKAFNKVWHDGLLFKLKSYGVQGELFSVLENYLKNRQQRVVLNGQHSTWKDVLAGFPQRSVLGPLLFLIYINDLPNNLVSSTKLFADDTSLFSIVTSIEKSCNDLNGDLDAIKMWAHQWKMSFNPDLNKQASEVVFSKKRTPNIQPPLLFNNAHVLVVPYQKHRGLTLDGKLAFDHHLNEKIAKANRGIGLIKQLSGSLPRSALVTMYRSFVRPHLDYADVIYDQPHNDTFCSRTESVQYNAALAITGAIRGTSREKIYQELGLESVRDRR